ncbi:MAG: DNA-binding protein [Muribaculaceae bacterium]|nr:DNA-binding protein [Muribaculaceae bacterium]
MSKVITFNELRNIKNQLPEGSIHAIADQLNVPAQTVRNYFGGTDYDKGSNMGIHIEPGPNGGYVTLDDTRILDMAMAILAEK